MQEVKSEPHKIASKHLKREFKQATDDLWIEYENIFAKFRAQVKTLLLQDLLQELQDLERQYPATQHFCFSISSYLRFMDIDQKTDVALMTNPAGTIKFFGRLQQDGYPRPQLKTFLGLWLYLLTEAKKNRNSLIDQRNEYKARLQVLDFPITPHFYDSVEPITEEMCVEFSRLAGRPAVPLPEVPTPVAPPPPPPWLYFTY